MNPTKFIDPKESPVMDVYKLMVGLIGPRPIGWISTVSESGVLNLAPYSFFNLFSNNPPVLGFSASLSRTGRLKDSLLNAKATKCFVHNMVTRDIADRMNQTSEEFPSDISEFEKAGLTPLASTYVKAPRVAEAKASIECELIDVISLGDLPGNGQLVLGRVVAIHIHDTSILADDGFVSSEKLALIGRLGRMDYSEVDNVFCIERP